MGSNEEIIQLLQKTQTIFKQTQRDKEEKYLNDIIQLQDKIKDLENVVCKMGRSTDTLRLLTSEQKAFRDNLHKSGVGYNGPCVLSQAYAKIPKLYRASELCDKNEQLHVFDSEETLEDAEKSQLKMNEFQKDEKIQELKIQPIDYEKLNKLYKDFVPQKERSAEQTFCSSSCISSVSKTSSENFASKTKPSMASMPSANPMLVILIEMDKYYRNLLGLLEKNHKRESFFYTSKEEQRLLIDGLSKRIVELEKDLSKSEAKCIAFEIARQHKSRENNSLKTVQIENENFMASLQLENAHLKQTYKDLFESAQWSKVETHQMKPKLRTILMRLKRETLSWNIVWRY
ncbi:hypothetical protein Tco_1349585 [Tanacetum coccineum]